MKKNIKKGISKGKMMAIGAGAAAVGVGAYYLLGPKGKAHRKKAAILMGKIKREVESKVKKAKKISAPIYHKTVDVVSQNYSKQYKAHEKDIKAIAQRLKNEWKEVGKLVKKTAKKRG